MRPRSPRTREQVALRVVQRLRPHERPAAVDEGREVVRLPAAGGGAGWREMASRRPILHSPCRRAWCTCTAQLEKGGGHAPSTPPTRTTRQATSEHTPMHVACNSAPQTPLAAPSRTGERAKPVATTAAMEMARMVETLRKTGANCVRIEKRMHNISGLCVINTKHQCP